MDVIKKQDPSLAADLRNTLWNNKKYIGGQLEALKGSDVGEMHSLDSKFNALEAEYVSSKLDAQKQELFNQNIRVIEGFINGNEDKEKEKAVNDIAQAYKKNPDVMEDAINYVALRDEAKNVNVWYELYGKLSDLCKPQNSQHNIGVGPDTIVANAIEDSRRMVELKAQYPHWELQYDKILLDIKCDSFRGQTNNIPPEQQSRSKSTSLSKDKNALSQNQRLRSARSASMGR